MNTLITPTNITPTNAEKLPQLVETVRQACIEAALDGYEMAAMNGLCHEGAWEAAISAMQTLDMAALVQAALGDQNSSR